jgi:hypothetical protein
MADLLQVAMPHSNFRISAGAPASWQHQTTIENHDWLGDHAPGFKSANGTIICNVGGGNVARSVHRIVSYGHDHSTIGKFRKTVRTTSK